MLRDDHMRYRIVGQGVSCGTLPEPTTVFLDTLVRTPSKNDWQPKGNVNLKPANLQATAAGRNSTKRGPARTRHFGVLVRWMRKL